MIQDKDKKYMKRALALARRGYGKTSPNPAVGCVIVKNGVIVGEGWHKKAGTPHAEVNALAMAGSNACGAEMYVTLEPCSHYGKTPPCCITVAQSGIKRVIAAVLDPNPLVSGRGIKYLNDAGIITETALLEDECRVLNEAFLKHISTGLPFITFKGASTLDGATATASGDSKWVTSEASRKEVHRMRSRSDAVMTGIGTVLADDPLLTSRIRGGRNPARIIVDSRLKIPLGSKIVNTASRVRTIVATTFLDDRKTDILESKGVEILKCNPVGGMVDLDDLIEKLGGIGIQSIILEGGSRLAGGMLDKGLIDKIRIFYAPKILGAKGTPVFDGLGAKLMNSSLMLEKMSITRIGADFIVEGYPVKPCSQA